ncbi:MAG: hypothetical protein KME16_14610 [Scytolyngbya sp. HA4215-MV1]|nr:hypothetical protein [Scytolyngbya sp. HA4215-MV1]
MRLSIEKSFATLPHCQVKSFGKSAVVKLVCFAAIAVSLSACGKGGLVKTNGTQLMKAVVQPVNAQTLNLFESGNGEFKLPNQTNRLSSASINVDNGGNAELVFKYAGNNRNLQLSGDLIASTANSATIQLTNSGNADVKGTAEIAYTKDNSIKRVTAIGTFDGQSFSLKFNDTLNPTQPSPSVSPSPSATPIIPNRPPDSQISLDQSGRGFLRLSGTPDEVIRQVSVVENNSNVDVYFVFTDGSEIVLSGELASIDASSLRVRLSSSAGDEATGQLDIDYGPGRAINNLFGQGTLAFQPFYVQFSSQPIVTRPIPGVW